MCWPILHLEWFPVVLHHRSVPLAITYLSGQSATLKPTPRQIFSLVDNMPVKTAVYQDQNIKPTWSWLKLPANLDPGRQQQCSSNWILASPMGHFMDFRASSLIVTQLKPWCRFRERTNTQECVVSFCISSKLTYSCGKTTPKSHEQRPESRILLSLASFNFKNVSKNAVLENASS